MQEGPFRQAFQTFEGQQSTWVEKKLIWASKRWISEEPFVAKDLLTKKKEGTGFTYDEKH